MFDREHRDLTHVGRWGILRRIRNQNVAEHSYYVTVYCIELISLLGVEVTPYETLQLVHSALVHDVDEIWTGDIPGPAKRVMNVDTKPLASSRMQEILPMHAMAHSKVVLSPMLRQILKVADFLEAVLYLCDERQLGNHSVGTLGQEKTPLGSNYMRLRSLWIDLPFDRDFLALKWKTVLQAIENAESGGSRILLQEDVL